jgi:hypothetical protein
MTALPLFYRLIVRPLRQERLRTTLTVLAVALGVAGRCSSENSAPRHLQVTGDVGCNGWASPRYCLSFSLSETDQP